MILTIVLVLGLTLAATGVATLVNRRRPDAPTSPTFAVPRQLDRDDFVEPDTPFLLALFSSATCLSCQEARELVVPLDLAGLAVHDVVHPDRADLHGRYGIDAVPTMVLADAEGVVAWAHVGPPPALAVVEMLSEIGLLPPDDGVGVDLPS